MRWYRVVKTVKGHRYLYDQRSWREGKKVRTQSRYIGPAGADTSVRSESQPRSLIASDTKQGDFEAELSGIKELYRGVNEGTTTKLHLNKLGRGLYTTTNLKSAQRYAGETGQVLKMNPATAMPQNPIRFKDDWEFFKYRDDLWEKYGIVRIETLIQKEGYDGIVVGRNGNFTSLSMRARPLRHPLLQ